MALLKAGWLHSTWFSSGWFQEDWWQDYGLVSVQPNAFVPKAVHSTYFPVAVHQSGTEGKVVHDTGTIQKGVKG